MSKPLISASGHAASLRSVTAAETTRNNVQPPPGSSDPSPRTRVGIPGCPGTCTPAGTAGGTPRGRGRLRLPRRPAGAAHTDTTVTPPRSRAAHLAALVLLQRPQRGLGQPDMHDGDPGRAALAGHAVTLPFPQLRHLPRPLNGRRPLRPSRPAGPAAQPRHAQRHRAVASLRGGEGGGDTGRTQQCAGVGGAGGDGRSLC